MFELIDNIFWFRFSVIYEVGFWVGVYFNLVLFIRGFLEILNDK